MDNKLCKHNLSRLFILNSVLLFVLHDNKVLLYIILVVIYFVSIFKIYLFNNKNIKIFYSDSLEINRREKAIYIVCYAIGFIIFAYLSYNILLKAI